MSRAVHTFRQSDVVRAIKAARAAGEDNFRVEITTDGRINVIVGKRDAPEPESDVDRWLKKHNAHQPQEP